MMRKTGKVLKNERNVYTCPSSGVSMNGSRFLERDAEQCVRCWKAMCHCRMIHLLDETIPQSDDLRSTRYGREQYR